MNDLPKRASLLDNVTDPMADVDLSKWAQERKPRKPEHSKQKVMDAAEEVGFVSREPSKPVRHRRKTHRTHQLNLKLTADEKAKFIAIADANNWNHGTTMAQLLERWEAQKAR